MPCSPRSASTRSLGALLAALCLAFFAACHTPAPTGSTQDLLDDLDGAEWRSNSLDLPFLIRIEALERRSWRDPEGTPGAPVVWNARPAGSIRLPVFSAEDSELRLRLRRHPATAQRLPVTVTLNGRLLGTVEPRVADEEYRFAVPASALVPGTSLLSFAATSRRQKGRLFALTAVELRPVRFAGAVAAPHRDGSGIVLPPASSIRLYVSQRAGGRFTADVEGDAQAPAQARLGLSTDAGSSTLADASVSGRRSLESEPAMADGTFARLEIDNPGRGPLRVLGLRLAAPQPPPVPPTPAPLGPKTSVVVFLTDTLRADHLSAYAHPRPTSPRFDAFAREGILFEDMWAQSPWTKPAIASIFTGLNPGSHGVVEFARSLKPDAATLAGAFRRAGYRTGAFVGNPLVNPRSRFENGFETWSNGGSVRLPPAEQLVKDALAWLDAGKGPFLLYVHTFEPHWLYQPRDEHWTPFRPSGPVPAGTLVQMRQRSDRDLAAREWVRSKYEGEIHQNDAAFGALLDGLRECQLLDASVVVFTADHGDEIRDHGGVDHATTLYQELLHVPLAVRLPQKRRAGTRDAQPIQQVDLLPSLLGLAGLPPLPDVEGRDLSARIREGVPELRLPELFAELHLVTPDKMSVRVGPVKLVVNNDLDRNPRARKRYELFDLAVDPHETRDLEDTRPVTTEYLASRILSLRAAHARRLGSGPVEELTLDAGEREELRALGYVQ